jgi:glycosyltransferase involved in cell wall biosynthesis
LGDLSTRKRLGLIFINDDQWVGGTYYIINLIHALNLMKEEEKPEIVAFSNFEDFSKLQIETKYAYLKYEKFDQEEPNVVVRIINKVTIKVLKKVIFRQQYNGYLDALFIMQRSEFLESVPFGKRIYWIPDFQDKHYPEFFTSKGLAKKHERSQWIADNARNIILSSESVKKDWVHFYPQYKGNTAVVHFAVTHPEYDSLDIAEIKNKFMLPEKYFFSPNQFWAHKNHMVVIQAAEKLKQQGNPVVITFSGKENDNRNPGYTAKLKKYVSENELCDVIRFLGFIDRREQLKLMKHSVAVIQPSLFEGWSTVIEDAMAMNQRIIASDLDVNIEQLGENGLYFKSNDVDDLAIMLQDTLKDDKYFDFNYLMKQVDFANNFMSCLP